ncbi:MAG: hypothetical protein WCK35_14895 [Chloroflexota bacterium]|jgi:hypothetical protein
MTNIAESFSNIVSKVDEEPVKSGSYLGVLIHAYRRKSNLTLEQQAKFLGMNAESLFKIECGFGSLEEINSFLSKMHSKYI